MDRADFRTAARVLVADDDGPFRSLASIVIKSAGHVVVEARDGTEALALLRAESFDLALLDIRMPGASGWEVLRGLVADRPLAEDRPRVLLMTGLTTEFDLERLRREGAAGMLIKPFQNEDLLAEVRRVLSLPSGATPA